MNMHAIFQYKNKQYQAKINKIINIDFLKQKIGNFIKIKKILVFSDKKNTLIGNPFIKNKKIIAKIISQKKYKKITILKFHRRKHYKKKQGHRQKFTCIKIIKIK